MYVWVRRCCEASAPPYIILEIKKGFSRPLINFTESFVEMMN